MVRNLYILKRSQNTEIISYFDDGKKQFFTISKKPNFRGNATKWNRFRNRKNHMMQRIYRS